MATSSPFRRPMVLVLLALALGGLGAGAYFLWWRKTAQELPKPGTPLYDEYLDAFQLGVAYLDAGLPKEAEAKLSQAIEKIPGEPAAWADRGLLHLRQTQPKEAASDLKRAHELAPDDPDINMLLGFLENKRGRYTQAAADLRHAVENRPLDLEARFFLAQLVAKKPGPESDAEYQRLMEDILKVQPNNMVALRERAHMAVRRGDAPAFKETVARFEKLAPGWSPESQRALANLKRAMAKSLTDDETRHALTTFTNGLQNERGFSGDAAALQPTAGVGGRSLHHFVRLQPPTSTSSPPDLALTFKTQSFAKPQFGTSPWVMVKPVWLTGQGPPAVLVANGHQVGRADKPMPALPFPGGKDHKPPSSAGVVPLDWKNEFRTDLLLAGAGGLRFFEQNKDGTFTDVTNRIGIDTKVLEADYYGAWAVDADMDGDMDIIAAPRTGPPLLLRNNGDGTFKAFKPFAGADGVRDFAWADFDNDGAPDAAFLDARGKVHVFANERSGQFRARSLPDEFSKVLALAQADIIDDGRLNLLALRSDGAVLRASDKNRGTNWDVAVVTRWREIAGAIVPGEARLLVADLDNNGSPDLILSGPQGSRIFLGEGGGKFKSLPTIIKQPVFAAANLVPGGRLDLLALSAGQQPLRLEGQGAKDYFWQLLMMRSDIKKAGKNQRVNSFTIGTEVEILAGPLLQKQMTTTPVVHFGLGNKKRINVIRFVWPTGAAQMEFEPAPNQVRDVVQRLTGSCPYLFTYDGKGMQFVTDFMWSTPLGMYINGQDRGGFVQTEEWVKIRGDQLVPRRGIYDVRVTANLWEAHYYDYMAMMVVDHPPCTEIFVDERFPMVPMKRQVVLTGPTHPVAHAWDDLGNDVTDIVRKVDAHYLDTFGKGRFQGVTRDHWVEVDLGKDAPTDGPLWLVAQGWIHPSNSSINFALAQGKHERPRPLVLEVPDGKGGWKVAKDDLGFPAGKNKTMLIRLDGIAGKGVVRRFRLRTNMEIFWDALQYARGLDGGLVRQKRLLPEVAELRYRGFQRMTQAGWSSPEIPHYEPALHGQVWRDQIGYYTRFGDVRELLAKVDDRYVIVNAGDEIAMRFAAPPQPGQGWLRDFVWISDGWTKDGDLNTRFSKTVLPLPYHGMTGYDQPPDRLEDDPVYRRFPTDWEKYHTRYVTPHEFKQGLRSLWRPAP